MQFVLWARHGKALSVERGASVKVINTHGSQVVDTWAFTLTEPRQYSSMDHTRSVNSNIFANRGTMIVSDRREPMLLIAEDSSPGRHDTLLCPCNGPVYRELGCSGYHRSCSDNLHEALSEFGIALPFTPASLNLFMNVPVADDGRVTREPPSARPGDHVVLTAQCDLLLVLSACPQDLTPINGVGRTPCDVLIEVTSPSGC